MKIKNKLLNRVVAVGMLAVVLLGCVPLTYADEQKETPATPTYEFMEKSIGVDGYYKKFCLDSSFNGRRVTFYNPLFASFVTAFISESPWSYSFHERRYQNFSLSSDYGGQFECFEFDYNGTTYYIGYYGMDSYPDAYEYTGKLGQMYVVRDKTYSVQKNAESLISDYISGALDSNESFTMVSDGSSESSTDELTWQGSRDNPIDDSNIGTLLLDRSKCYWTEGGSDPTVQRISWLNKTDSGFSLNNNKYALTRIEVKIGNRVTYFGDVEHHGTGKPVDNFGQVYSFKYVNPKNNPYDFSFTEMLTASQTDLERYNASMLEHEYDLYFRVICADAIGTSAKYYCGGWTRYRCTDDPKQDGDNESDDGHFNENGEWEKDKDTDVDSGGIGIVKDEDDKEDDFKNFTDSENWKDWIDKSGLTIDKALDFIGQLSKVPQMIQKALSFLPDWVVAPFYLAFALIPIIIIYKLLRG